MSASNAMPSRVRGVTGTLTRQVLEALREPGNVASLMTELGLLRADAWALIKHLHEQGRVERVARGLYRITALGTEALTGSAAPAAPRLGKGIRRPPAGEGRTPERARWLEQNYGRLGRQRCAEQLCMTPGAVWAWAHYIGLKAGEVNGYILITDLEHLIGIGYTVIYSRAERAGVLAFPDSSHTMQNRRHAMVPEVWADAVVDERQPPTPDDTALADLRERLGISKTQAMRVAGREAYLRTPVSGGQPRLYVSRATELRIRQRYEKLRRKPKAKVVGRAGVLASIGAAGQEGLSERQLAEQLGCSRAAVRIHVHALWLSQETERCRLGDTLDPFVYRLVIHAGAPVPERRQVVIPGRRPATPAELGIGLDVVEAIRAASPAPVADGLRQRRRRGEIQELAERFGTTKAIVFRVLYTGSQAKRVS